MCSCSAMADAREAGSQKCSCAGFSILSPSCSGQLTAAARISVSPGSSWRLLTSRWRRAPGKCVFSTDTQRSSLSTCMSTSWPAWENLQTTSRRDHKIMHGWEDSEGRGKLNMTKWESAVPHHITTIEAADVTGITYPKSIPPMPVNKVTTFMPQRFWRSTVATGVRLDPSRARTLI